MKYFFSVQGEGRGHLTQSLALAEQLRAAGHEIVAVYVGNNGARLLPKFFYEKMGTPITEIFSPNFVFDKERKGIRLKASIINNLLSWNKITASLRQLRQAISEYQPDVVINFFEPLTGLLYGIYRPAPPLICIGHQYLNLHPDFIFPPHSQSQKRLIRFFTRLTSLNATKRLALSFDQLPDFPKKDIFVVPPLLRPEIFKLEPKNDKFLLIYLLNHGYSSDIMAWQALHKEVEIHVFWDNLAKPDGYSPQPKLVFHHINDRLFLEKLNACQAYASTAGFESICEAAYLGKPLMLVPSRNHFEQECNAIDAERCGLGISRKEFILDDLLELTKNRLRDNRSFKSWVDSADKRFRFHTEVQSNKGRTASQ